MTQKPNPQSGRLVKSRRLLSRVSLRILLVVCISFGAGLGWFGQRIVQQKRGVAKFNELQSSLKADGLYYDYQIRNRDASPPYPDWLIRIIGIDAICTVKQVRVVLGKNAELLSFFPQLKTTEIYHPSGSDLESLLDCNELEEITISYPSESLDWTPLFKTKNLKYFAVLGGKWNDKTIEKLKTTFPKCEFQFFQRGAEDDLFQGVLY